MSTLEQRVLVGNRDRLVWRGRTPHYLGAPPPPPPPQTSSLFAGHIPGRNFWGMNASESSRPLYDEAMTIIGGPIYVGRRFSSGEVTTPFLSSSLQTTDAGGQYAVLSAKVSGNNWTAVKDGQRNAMLNIIRDFAIARRNSGGSKFAFTLHHEPDGNGPTGVLLTDLTIWGQMQIYCSNYFSGWTTTANGNKGTYTAANDVSDIMAWCCIANGHWFGKRFPKPDRIAAAMPDNLYTVFVENKSVGMADFYDANPPDGNRDYPNSPQPIAIAPPRAFQWSMKPPICTAERSAFVAYEFG